MNIAFIWRCARRLSLTLVPLLTPLLSGCASVPNVIPDIVSHYRLQESVVSSDLYDLRVYRNQVAATEYLHIYVPGDGVPWLHRVFIATDPTPKNSLVLHMVGVDKNPALFLGRPCYYGLHESRNCHYDLWTQARFSERVVSSMVQAVQTLLQDQPHKKVILFGVSGGGTLVTLMAPRIPEVVAVVTVVGNLNTDLWTQEHHYQALRDSLNPYDMQNFPENIRQIHLIGGQDTNVTAAVTQSYVAKFGGDVWEYPGYSHGCCWLDIWPGVLQGVHKKVLSAAGELRTEGD